ncbi:MAG TPA: ferredoxin [Pseudonocardiaceae bacterium]|jgi:ferredoxin|nr:ferredoxin [Pseudonocardiaceae bacterium]
MKVTVDVARCMGHGQCEIAAPSLFEIDDDGIAQVLQENPGEGERGAAQTAALRCPEAAIHLTD